LRPPDIRDSIDKHAKEALLRARRRLRKQSAPSKAVANICRASGAGEAAPRAMSSCCASGCCLQPLAAFNL